jgi:hypothetical protein
MLEIVFEYSLLELELIVLKLSGWGFSSTGLKQSLLRIKMVLVIINSK